MCIRDRRFTVISDNWPTRLNLVNVKHSIDSVQADEVVQFSTSMKPSTQFTRTCDPGLMAAIGSTSSLSISGIFEIIAPTATIVSLEALMIAAGAFPFLLSSYITYDPTVDPLPCGKVRTEPTIETPYSSCFKSIMTPRSGSTPPKNESCLLYTSDAADE